ncbi:hypothetical protein PF005_g23402 [Phytophthora fragariae]|uniref:Uncharacterized protein n=1 Tax=Phytophthora fragariae TaxID=53985 RepID=A0A6A4CLN7_9STRA|nr:hypothetical protein PF009_g2198 [Phytophthora fragariae]KAE8982439.1 hypothetical protein PF011_g21618 [Phytophthora fragariae]KAE9086049.1 hypothetical protein PF010_g20234 [Phytophthora fragariae]KAE9114640.1 hypothetical protein PF006_g19467 [Phytophthora fragariae]KAE9137395.1 hypothetical protein PF007_g1806 [Phytophthora fragariae]
MSRLPAVIASAVASRSTGTCSTAVCTLIPYNSSSSSTGILINCASLLHRRLQSFVRQFSIRISCPSCFSF